MKKEQMISSIIFIALLLGWEVAVTTLGISSLILPAPSLVFTTLWEHLKSGYMLPHIKQTTLEIAFGLFIGSLLGMLLGLLMGESRFLRGIITPYLIASQAVPKLALAPLFMLWFGFGTTPKVVITALICFFPLLENTVTAIQYVEQQKQDLFKVLKASRWQTLTRLKIPAGIPGIMAGMRVATVLAVVGAVVGEFIGASKGLGAVIIASQAMLNTPLMFASIILLTVIGMVLYLAITIVERILMKPYRKG